MQAKHHTFANGKNVSIYDNLIPAPDRDDIYNTIIKLAFRIGWEDTQAIERSQYRFLHHAYAKEEINQLPLLFHLARTPVFQHVAGKKLIRAIVNLSTPGDVYFPHAHQNEHVILYYANPSWETQWFGETLFYDDNAQEVELAVSYRPGRIVYFDGGIPHALRPQSTAAPGFRFTLALFFADAESA